MKLALRQAEAFTPKVLPFPLLASRLALESIRQSAQAVSVPIEAVGIFRGRPLKNTEAWAILVPGGLDSGVQRWSLAGKRMAGRGFFSWLPASAGPAKSDLHTCPGRDAELL